MIGQQARMENYTSGTTIAALATAPAPAGIAVVRISGPASRAILKILFRSKIDPSTKPRQMIFGEMVDFKTGEYIDTALAVFMKAPFSFTGEDIVEFQFHGSPLLVQKILRSAIAAGATPAEPGEFTKRAFLNSKLDLVQAEAIGDLINATSEQALKIAEEHLHGRFSKAINELGEPLRNGLAEVEASIDFADEEISPAKVEEIGASLKVTQKKIEELLQTYAYGQVVKEGFKVLLCGRPNAGKSSILNLLLGRSRAIVSEISGTTRDLIEEAGLLGGFRFVFCDAAGITNTDNVVEKLGIELAKEKIAWADLVLFVVDASDSTQEWQEVLEYLRGRTKKIWMVVNKIDLNQTAFGSFYCDSTVCTQNFFLSAKTKDGLTTLTEALIEEQKHGSGNAADSSHVVTNERHRNCLTVANTALTTAIDVISTKLPVEILSEELRRALIALEEIVGRTHNEDILGRIFSKFCIGK